MRRFRGLWVLVAAFALGGCAERERPKIADGRLSVDRNVDFGTVAIHAGREEVVTLTNVGRGTVNIIEVSSLGPPETFAAHFTHQGPHALITGGTCEVAVRYTPHSGDSHDGFLLVHTDSLDEPVFRVAMHGRGIDAAAHVLTDQLDFGRIEADAQKTLQISLENSAPIPVSVSPAVFGADKDEFTLPDPFVMQPGESRQIDLAFHPVRVGKKLAGVTVTPCEGCGDVYVKVYAEALEQAVVPEPALLNYGQVAIDRDETRTVTLHNISTEPMDVTGLSFAKTSDPSFTFPPPGLPITLKPDEKHGFAFNYSPGHMGYAYGTGLFHVNSKRHPTTDVALKAFGGASELCVSPVSYEFGDKPVGSKSTAIINIKNCGASNAAPMTITGMTILNDPNIHSDQYSLGPATIPATLAAGDEINVKLFFEPTHDGLSSAIVHLTSTAPGAEDLLLEFNGSATQHAPCDLTITPAAVDFGTVRPGHGAVLGVKIENRGADLCAVKNVQLASDAGGTFYLPGGGHDGLIMDPGNAFSMMIAFKAPATGSGSYTAALQVEQANPTVPVRMVPIKANVQTSCLVATPGYLDFGETRPDCGAPVLVTSLENACATPITVNQIVIGPGTTDGEFAIAQAPATPLLMQPGDRVSVAVSYAAQVPGMNLSPLFIDASGLAAPYLVTLLGESNTDASATDTFVQTDGSKVDVLFVVDNTASMVEEQPRLINALPDFVQTAQQKGVDLHVAVTTTGIEPASNGCPGGAMGGEAGRLFPADNSAKRLLTSNDANLTSELQANANVGLCAFVEKGLEATRRALSPPLVDSADDPRTALANDGNLGFLRTDAALAVVIVGDEDDHSPDDVDTYVRFIQGLKGAGSPGRARIYAIAPSGNSCATAGGTGTRYATAAVKTGGQALDVCAKDYSPLLAQVAGSAFGPQDHFPLSSKPEPNTLEVKLDGSAASGWTYDAATNQIVFATKPTPGATIEVTYKKACP